MGCEDTSRQVIPYLLQDFRAHADHHPTTKRTHAENYPNTGRACSDHYPTKNGARADHYPTTDRARSDDHPTKNGAVSRTIQLQAEPLRATSEYEPSACRSAYVSIYLIMSK